MVYALGLAAVAVFIGIAQAVPAVASSDVSSVAPTIATSAVPAAVPTDQVGGDINFSTVPVANATTDDEDSSVPVVTPSEDTATSFIISGEDADILIASDALALLSTTHDVSVVDGHIIVTIPNKYLNNASKILDLVQNEIVSLGQLVGKLPPKHSSVRSSPTNFSKGTLVSNHSLPQFSPEHVQRIVERVSGPATLAHEALLAATHVVKHIGLKVKTPSDLKQTASDPTCDGICLLLKANKIITEVTTFSNFIAGKVGLEPVLALVKPIVDAAEALVIQLDGDLPSSSSAN